MNTYHYATNDCVEHECEALCSAQAIAIARQEANDAGLFILWVGIHHCDGKFQANSGLEVLWSYAESHHGRAA